MILTWHFQALSLTSRKSQRLPCPELRRIYSDIAQNNILNKLIAKVVVILKTHQNYPMEMENESNLYIKNSCHIIVKQSFYKASLEKYLLMQNVTVFAANIQTSFGLFFKYLQLYNNVIKYSGINIIDNSCEYSKDTFQCFLGTVYFQRHPHS